MLKSLSPEENVHMYEMAFEQQYHFGLFYAWVKLREQEIRNIRRGKASVPMASGVGARQTARKR